MLARQRGVVAVISSWRGVWRGGMLQAGVAKYDVVAAWR